MNTKILAQLDLVSRFLQEHLLDVPLSFRDPRWFPEVMGVKAMLIMISNEAEGDLKKQLVAIAQKLAEANLLADHNKVDEAAK